MKTDHPDHVEATLLAAYYDGALNARQAARVEAHLAVCETCCARLEGLQALSGLLQEAPPAPLRLSEERFVAQVALQMEHREERVPAQGLLAAGWRWAPVVMVGAWSFLQATVVVATALVGLLAVGVGGGVLAGAAPPQDAGRLGSLLALLGLADVVPDIGAGLSLARLAGGFGLVNLVLPLVMGLLVWSWLATWWVTEHNRRNPALGAGGETAGSA